MAEKSGFFNALNIDGGYDRTYNADDYSENLATIISSGVLRSSNDDLNVTASGLIATVAAGRAWINGHYYLNDTPIVLTPTTAPTGGSRYDRIILRFDNTIQGRKISIVYLQGTASNAPTAPEITRTDSIYDLVLADLYITANATSMTVTDQRANANLCGWVYSTSGDNSFFTSLDNSFYTWFNNAKDTLSSVTLFKRYSWTNTLAAPTNAVAFNIPQYDANTCFIEVYVNGFFTSNYTLANNIITFAAALTAGTQITVNCYKSIDGTGIMSVADEITQLQNAVAALNGIFKYTYNCTGLNDNITISQIANAFIRGSYDDTNVTTAAATAFLTSLGGNTYLAALPVDAQITIDITGKFGVASAYIGAGTTASPYRFIACGSTAATQRKVVLDFAKCEKIELTLAANTTNSIFYGANIFVKNANIYADGTATACNVLAFECAGNTFDAVKVENSKITVVASGSARIAEHGTFTNCYGYCKSNGGTAYCFKPKTLGLIRLNGGTFLAYGLTSAGIGSAITHTSAGDTDAVLMAFNIHCPMITEANYTQTYLSVANAGNTYINGVVSRLPSNGSYNEITGQIQKNKAD